MTTTPGVIPHIWQIPGLSGILHRWQTLQCYTWNSGILYIHLISAPGFGIIQKNLRFYKERWTETRYQT